ncbi:MAG: hypothetical protein KGP28_11035 [Bdellovibrionales bacterium]|nr:hypothetical protein [Bdellovibrionales bacterium]
MKIWKVSGCLGVLFFSLNAIAVVNSINVQTYNPSTSDRFVILEDGFRSEWPKTTRLYFGMSYNYVSEPFVALDSTGTTKLGNIIDNIQTIDTFLGIKLSNNFAVFIGMPVHFITFPNTQLVVNGAPQMEYQTGSTTSLGDLKVMGKIRLTDDASPTSIALIPEIHFATGDTFNFVSDASTYIALRAALERQFQDWTLIVNLGYASAMNSFYINPPEFPNAVDYRKRLIAGVGGFLPFSRDWGLNFELQSISMLPFNPNISPNDAYLGFRYGSPEGLALTAGAAVGHFGGPQGQDFRVITGIRYTLFEKEDRAPRPLSK